MTNHQKGYRRDRTVIETLREWGTMDTEQLRILFYPSDRVARRRLKILTDKGKVKRYREAIEIPYIYSLGKHDIERLVLNWLRIWILRRLKSWEVIELFDYEMNTCSIRNTATGGIKTINTLYNANSRTWLSGDTIIIYDTDEKRKAVAKRIKGKEILLTIDEVKEGLKCAKCS